MRLLSRLLKLIGIKRDHVKILCLGLDNAGKSTVVAQLRGGIHANVSPHSSGPVTAAEGASQDSKHAGESVTGSDHAEEPGEQPSQETEPQPKQVKQTVSKHSVQGIVPTQGFQVEIFQRQNVQFTIFDMSGQGTYRDMWSFFYKDCMAVLFVIDSSDRERISTVRDEVQYLTRHKCLKNKPFVFLCNKQDIPGVMSVEECVELLGLQDQSVEWHIVPTKALENEGIAEGINWVADRVLS